MARKKREPEKQIFGEAAELRQRYPGLTWRDDGSLAMTPPYTPEEQTTIDAWRRHLRLKLAREAFERARDRYLEMKLLDAERAREEEVVN